MFTITRKTVQICFFLFTLLSFSACSNHESASAESSKGIDLALLLGEWESVNSPQNKIKLTETRMYSYVGDLQLSDESLMIYNNCVAKCVPEGVTPMPCLVTDGKAAQNCFELLELTKNTLSYTLIGGNGTVFSFKRGRE